MNIPINNTVNPPTPSVPTQMPVQPQGTPFSPVGTIAATLTIASAASIGSNLIDVRNGSMSLPLALVNGVVKGAAASYILSKTTRSTTTEVLVAAGFLAGAAYFIDSKMKKNVKAASKEQKC